MEPAWPLEDDLTEARISVRSERQLAQFVAEVRAATAASEVDIVGYSQGATVARYYVNRLGGAAMVDQWIGLASPTYGGTLFGLVPVLEQTPGGMQWARRAIPPDLVSPALEQQAQGSPFLDDLNGGADTVPGARYTTIGSRLDGSFSRRPTSRCATGRRRT